MMITKRPNQKIDEVKQLDLDSLSQKIKKGKKFYNMGRTLYDVATR